ncbi:Icc-related predicted phosphoesterase [Sinorhizobium fredii]|uniref:Putative metallophosphoesterase n=1 Tax=Sinorhizobium fredii (strain USDA 257) TaxID=1185652 RepID=I3XDQ1_SINF2|nr:metallophosphoesterase [Sinorhizobium fredii]AFL54007.1 putative metallophosphoesterase [Sinorhizobium fredii USDA 257]
MGNKLKVAAVADLHMKEDGSVSYAELFSEVSKVADVLVIAGDLTDLGKPAEAELLASDLKYCTVPVVAVLGNHDHQCNAVEEISSILMKAGVHLLDGQAVEIAGIGFAGTKGFVGGFGRHMLGSFGETALKTMVSATVDEAMRLENALRKTSAQHSVVVLHYAPIAETVAGEPEEIYPFLGSSRFAETIDRFHVSAVVHGHAHKGTYKGTTPGGAPVFNVAAHVEKPTGRPYAILEF